MRSLQACMFILVVVAVGATIMCYFWAPETRDLTLCEASGGGA